METELSDRNTLQENTPLETRSPASPEAAKAEKLPQIIATVTANFLAFSAGTLLTWTSPAIPLLQNDNSLFRISEQESSWVGSLLSLGAALGGPPFGMMVNKMGRKRALLALSLPVTASWIVIACTRSVIWLCIARFASGITLGGVCFVVPIYVAEIAEPSIRGPLSAIMQVAFNVGILFVYALGTMEKYMLMNLTCLAIPIIFVLQFMWMPETPQYFLSKDNRAGAAKSLQWLRGKNHNVENELQQLKEHADEEAKNRGSLRAALTNPVTVKALLISTGLVSFQQLTGICVVLFYTETIFQAVGSTMSASLSSVIVGVVMLISSILIIPIMDRAGRRVLLLVSCSFGSLSLLALGLYFFLKEQLQLDVSAIGWLPLVCLIVYISTYCLGIGPLPWVVMSEVLPPNAKGCAGAIVSTVCWMTSFGLTNSFQMFVDYVGRYGAFWSFAFYALLAVAFVYYKVPETKGISLQEIQERLAGTRRENVNGSASL